MNFNASDGEETTLAQMAAMKGNVEILQVLKEAFHSQSCFCMVVFS